MMKRYLGLFLVLLLSGSAYAQTDLNDYLKMAAEQNPSLKAKFSMYMAALEKVNQYGSLPDPTVSFGYFISPVETRVGAQRFKLSLGQMFPWMGTLKVREQAAASMAKVKFEAFEEAKSQLFLKVQSKWLELYELKQEIGIMMANLEILRSFEPITRTKYEANLVSLADLIRVQINIDNAETQLDLSRLKEAPLLADFNTMLNRPLTTNVVLSDALDMDSHSAISKDSLMNQPRVQQARANLESIDFNDKLADLKRKPNIGLGLEYGFISKRSDVSVADNGKDILVPTVSLSLPVFGKKNRSVKKEVALRREGFEAELMAVENEIKNEWVNADYQIESSKKELELYQTETEKIEVLLSVLTSEYSNNNRDFEVLLSTQQRLLQLQLAKVNTQVKYHRACFKKEYLTGQTLNQIR